MIREAQLIIFDLDGTLIDSRHDLGTAVNLMRKDLGLQALPIDQVMSYIGGGIRALVERSLADATTDIDAAIKICFQRYLEHLHDETVLYEGVQDGLVALRERDITLAVMTNKPSNPTDLLLEHFKIRSLFSAVLAGDTAPKLKPHPSALTTIATLCNIRPDYAWMVGDHVFDLEAARRAGMRSIFVEYGIGHPGDEQATRRFGSFKELVRFFVS